jgi:lipopolysaccharide/colanic/teichoic acid biosynthesis glycosyltransferase
MDRISEGTALPRPVLPGVVDPYPRSKRALDLVLGTVGLVAAAPILLGIRVAMVASGDRGPFLYRARRVGEGAAPITVLKVRSMETDSSGVAVTARDDPRVTRVGRTLRRYKLDELPQLWNVLRGDMALVGPRPEDPTYVDLRDPVHRRVFSARPGITGLAQLEYRHEAEMLDGPDPETTYRELILPAKLALDLAYLDRRSVGLDLRILARTAAAIVAR